MGDTRPDFKEYYQMALDIRADVDKGKILICPVDHGAFMDSLYMRQPMQEAGLDIHFYRRGPYTLWPKLMETLENTWFERVLGQNVEREDCIEQNTTKIFGEFRQIVTSEREVAKYIEEIGGIDFFYGFDDWADSGISALGVYVFGLINHRRLGIPLKNVRLAASSDSTGGLAHVAARRSVPRIYPSPEAYMKERRPKTFEYLDRKGLIRPDYEDPLTPISDSALSFYKHTSPDLVLLKSLLRTGVEP